MYDLYYKDVRLIGSLAGSFGMWYESLCDTVPSAVVPRHLEICRYAADGVYVQTKTASAFSNVRASFLGARERGEGDLLALIEERLTDFNSVNAATALFRLVKVRALHTTEQWV
jgi:hypothetical protein